jgi:N-acetylmuramoyl-L-alanine amidase
MKNLYKVLLSILTSLVFISCSNRTAAVPLVSDVGHTLGNNNKTIQASLKELSDKPIAEDNKGQVIEENKNNKTSQKLEGESLTSTEGQVSKASDDDGKAKNKNENSEQVKNNRVIVLDPGHASKSNLAKEPAAPDSKELKIKDGGGAQGIATRTPEYKINMEVALKLKNLLEAKGYMVIMTKTENSVSLGNVERAEIWNRANADLAVRIHADSSNDASVRGASMLIPSGQVEYTKPVYNKSKEYGKIVLDTLTAQVGMRSRGIIESKDMTGFNWSKVPVILVEMGFLSNMEEDRLLSSKEYQDKICKALAEGISLAVK